MVTKKTIPVIPLDGDPELERTIYFALQSEGLFFATTEAEVAREEERQAKESLGALESDNKVIAAESHPRQGTVLSCVWLTDDRITEDLARAARGGKSIPPEVEQRMQADRIAAESQESK